MFLQSHESDRSVMRRRKKAMSAAVVAGMFHLLLALPPAAADHRHRWSDAVSVDPLRQAGVNTNANDGCPIEAPDAHTLFIATNRVGSNGLDIWIANRTSADGPWSDAQPLPGPVNTAANEFCPTPLPGNRLLFVRAPGACGAADVYFTRLRMSPLEWTEPVPLPCGTINSPDEEFSPSLVQAGGQTMLFFSSNRDTLQPGVHKIYWSRLLPDGTTWTVPERIEELSAWGFSDARPNVTADGLEMVFDSNRAGTFDVYITTRGNLEAAWSHPRRIASDINSDSADETRASFSRDGQRLYFGSTRANAELGGGGADVYVATRTAPGADKGH